eukprot:2631789-Pyramimonas_sp.AAC.1
MAGPAQCDQCPPDRSTLNNASTTFADCVCASGYLTAADGTCEVRAEQGSGPPCSAPCRPPTDPLRTPYEPPTDPFMDPLLTSYCGPTEPLMMARARRAWRKGAKPDPDNTHY